MWYFDYLDDEDEREQEILDALRAEEEAKIEAAERAELEAEEARIAEMLAEKPDWLKHEEEEAARRAAMWTKIYEQEKANHFNYAIKEKIVKAGNSIVFNTWHKRGVSEEDFLEGLKWVCDDPLRDGGYDGRWLTRALGCEPNGRLVKLTLGYDRLLAKVLICEEKENGYVKIWAHCSMYKGVTEEFIQNAYFTHDAEDRV